MNYKERQLVKALEIMLVYAAYQLAHHTDMTEDEACFHARCNLKVFLADETAREALKDLLTAKCDSEQYIFLDLVPQVGDITSPNRN